MNQGRWVATRVLHRVAQDDAWAAPTLDAELRRHDLDARDAALATEIVYGALRVLPRLDASIGAHLKRRARVDPWARAALRTCAYQLLHLARVPPHAVVNDTVAIVRNRRGREVGGFINAIARKLTEARPAKPTLPEELVVPDWVNGALQQALGAERTKAFLRARSLPPPIGLRVCTAERSPEEALEMLQRARPEAEVRPGRVAPRALLVRRAGDPRALPGYAEGWITVQEEGSQLVGLSTEAHINERVADACAGRGNKTLQLAEAVGEGGSVVAIDRDERQLDRIAPELERVRLPRTRVQAEPIDLTVGTAQLDATFDRVLVDAPCTNLGTIHRRPELLLRLGGEDPERLARTQLSIVDHALRLVRPGGTLIYAVCSPTRQEGAEVVEALEQRHPTLRRLEAPTALEVPAEADGIARIGPWQAPDMGPDAYQVARWVVP